MSLDFFPANFLLGNIDAYVVLKSVEIFVFGQIEECLDELVVGRDDVRQPSDNLVVVDDFGVFRDFFSGEGVEDSLIIFFHNISLQKVLALTLKFKCCIIKMRLKSALVALFPQCSVLFSRKQFNTKRARLQLSLEGD